MTYAQAIKEAKARYAEAMDNAAADVLYIVTQFGKPRATVCKDIAGDGWNALDHRARALEKTAGQTPEQRRAAVQARTERDNRTKAKIILKDPEEAQKVLSSLPPQALDTVYHEAKLIRAGEDRSPATRKAAQAAAHHAVAPLKKAVATMSMDLAIQAQKEVTDDLKEAMEEDAITPASFARLEAAFNETAEVMAEVRFKLPAKA